MLPRPSPIGGAPPRNNGGYIAEEHYETSSRPGAAGFGNVRSPGLGGAGAAADGHARERGPVEHAAAAARGGDSTRRRSGQAARSGRGDRTPRQARVSRSVRIRRQGGERADAEGRDLRAGVDDQADGGRGDADAGRAGRSAAERPGEQLSARAQGHEGGDSQRHRARAPAADAPGHAASHRRRQLRQSWRHPAAQAVLQPAAERGRSDRCAVPGGARQAPTALPAGDGLGVQPRTRRGRSRGRGGDEETPR